MNNNETIGKLKNMRLNAMAELHGQQVKSNQLNNITPDEYLALLADHEWEDRQNRKTTRLLSQAKFRYKAYIEEIDFIKENKYIFLWRKGQYLPWSLQYF